MSQTLGNEHAPRLNKNVVVPLFINHPVRFKKYDQSR